MAILRTSEIRTMTAEERADELENLKNELVRERALTSAGGAPENPGRIGEIRRTIARIKTIQNELNEI
jgi:large subunit ribosomal protein L29